MLQCYTSNSLTIKADYQITFQKDYSHLRPHASASDILNADS